MRGEQGQGGGFWVEKTKYLLVENYDGERKERKKNAAVLLSSINRNPPTVDPRS